MSALPAPLFTVEMFEAGAIDADAFDHEAHIYVAWLYLERFSLLEAVDRFSAALRRLTAQFGVPGKYHATITWFYLFLIEERRQQSGGDDWYCFRRKHKDLFVQGETNILKRYYNGATLGSDQARRSFVMPDRLAS